MQSMRKLYVNFTPYANSFYLHLTGTDILRAGRSQRGLRRAANKQAERRMFVNKRLLHILT